MGSTSAIFYLAIAGLGLLIIWPRFILLIVYVHMLWFYYLLASSEEGRIHAQYGDSYLEFMRNTSMFIPGEPGGRVRRLLFGWMSNRRLRLLVIYCISLGAVIGGAIRLRELSLRLTTHLTSLDRKVAAVSFWRSNEAQLGDLVQSAMNDREVHARLARQAGWIMVLAAERKESVVHTLIDAGMTRGQAANVPMVDRETQLIFLRRVDHVLQAGPFSARAHWRPFFIAQMESGHVNHLMDLDEHLFRANPVMPIF